MALASEPAPGQTRCVHAGLERVSKFVTEQGPSPRLGLVLGSGLGDFVQRLEAPRSLAYGEIQGMPRSTVSGHAGHLWAGAVGGESVVCLQGRSHLYEGYTAAEVVSGVRLLAALGVESVLLTNAAGGFGDGVSAGDLMLITDHLNLTGHNPLVGPVPERGPRFTDMTVAYDRTIRRLAVQAAEEVGVELKAGVYAGVLGPSYETPAEVRMLEHLGAHAVGMSTVLETIALRQLGVRVGAISLISNLAAGLSGSNLSHAEVESTAHAAKERFGGLLERWCALVLRTPA